MAIDTSGWTKEDWAEYLSSTWGEPVIITESGSLSIVTWDGLNRIEERGGTTPSGAKVEKVYIPPEESVIKNIEAGNITLESAKGYIEWRKKQGVYDEVTRELEEKIQYIYVQPRGLTPEEKLLRTIQNVTDKSVIDIAYEQEYPETVKIGGRTYEVEWVPEGIGVRPEIAGISMRELMAMEAKPEEKKGLFEGILKPENIFLIMIFIIILMLLKR